MSNILTGDFDVVAEFALPAVNRILAAMHECERFLHSISVRVNDNPPPGPVVPYPTVLGVVDELDRAIANQLQVNPSPVAPGPNAATNSAFARFGGIINPGQLVFTQGGGVTPSQISGVAQLQLFPPTVSVPQGLSNYITLTTNVMVRYFPDKGSASLAEFMRGNVSITAPVNKIASGNVHVLDIDFKASDATIAFTPTYTSKSLSDADLAGISLCIQNGLRSSFLPSSVTLPSSIADVQLKAMPNALAVLLDLNDHTPASNVASVTNVFLGPGDDFAFAVSGDYILSVFNSWVGNFTQFQPFNVSVFLWGTTTYTITLTSTPTLALQSGAIVLTINAHAHSSKSRFPSFNFRTNVSFTLELVATGEGGLNAAQLALADVSLDFTDSGLSGDIKDLILGAFKGNIQSQISAQVNNVLNPPVLQPGDLQSTIRQMTDADANLGDFVTAQFSPADGTPSPYDQRAFLMYNSFEIQPAGVVLHGSVALYDWPQPYVEFEQIPAAAGPVIVTQPWGQGKDYSALNSWIPGGTIQQYEWSYEGQPNPFHTDPNTFVLLASGPSATEAFVATGGAVSAYTPLCLTVTGTRISNFGSEAYPSVSGSACAFTRVSLLSMAAVANAGGVLPSVALTRSGPDGNIVLSGYTTAQSGGNPPNLIVHFADTKTANQLGVLTQALAQSKKTDVATAIVAILPPGQLAKTRYTAGVTYTEDADGSWRKVLAITSSKPPLTAIVGPRGTVAWQAEGAPDASTLAAALAKSLVPTGSIGIGVPRLRLRAGQSALNFLFEFSPGREIPLSKLSGQPVVIVFWKSSSRPSIDAVKDAQTQTGSSGIVLAVNDGESSDIVRAIAAENRWTAIAVPDPNREITSAYGVSIWPTIVTLSQSGVIASVAYGYPQEKHGVAQPAVAAQ